MAKKRWLAEARESMERRGTVGSYGKASARKTSRDIKRGGKIGKKAQFAANMRKIAARRKRRGRHGRGRKSSRR